MAQWQIVTLADRKTIVWLPILVGSYFVAGKLGLQLAFVHPSATAVWAPSGIALAAFLVLGYRVWPGIFAGAFLVNVTTAGSVLTSLGIATGNTLEGLVGAWLVVRFARGRHAFERPADVFKFAALAGLLTTTIAPTLGVTSLALGGFAPWSDYPTVWYTWWLGDVVGVIVVAPLLVLWGTGLRGRWGRARVIEAVLALASLVLASELAFGGLLGKDHPLEFLCVIPLVWIALRLGARETATANVALSGLALANLLAGGAAFPEETAHLLILFLQAFLTIPAVMALALSAAATERRAFEHSLRQSEEQHRAIAALTSDFAVVAQVGRDGTIVLEAVTDGFGQVTGYTVADVERSGDWSRLVDPADRATLARATHALLADGQVSGELRMVHRNGATRWVRYFARRFGDSADGSGGRFLAAVQDITDRKRAEDELAKRQEMIRVLSTPVLPLRDRLLILPIIGDVDPPRARQLTQQLSEAIRAHRAKAVVLDLSGVAEIAQAAAGHLAETVDTARLLGATAILSGVSTRIAQRLVAIGIDMTGLRTAGDLGAGLEQAMKLLQPEPASAGPADRPGPGAKRRVRR